LDRGGGKVKELDRARAPLVRAAFELYATATYNLETLNEEIYRRGLRNRRGGRVSMSGLSKLLNNPFYIGIIRLDSTGETFAGAHQALIRKSLFDRVHGVLTGKINAKTQRHDFLYRRLFKCGRCRFSLIGETQKSHVYYRCHSKSCPAASVREEALEQAVVRTISPIALNEADCLYLAGRIEELTADWKADQEAQAKAKDLQRAQLVERLAHLTDAFVEGLIDRTLFEERKNALLLQRQSLDEQMAVIREQSNLLAHRLHQILELCKSPCFLHNSALPEERRSLLEIVTSNRSAIDKNVEITLAEPFRTVANRANNSNGSPYRDTPRTLDVMIDNLVVWFKLNPAVNFDAASELLEDHSLKNDSRKEGKRAA
jgi:hypothetical protein